MIILAEFSGATCHERTLYFKPCNVYIHTYAYEYDILFLKVLFCNAGERVLKKKYATTVEYINSGVIDETKAICKIFTIECQCVVIRYLNFSTYGAMVD